jgi:hypothetical protein
MARIITNFLITNFFFTYKDILCNIVCIIQYTKIFQLIPDFPIILTNFLTTKVGQKIRYKASRLKKCKIFFFV